MNLRRRISLLALFVLALFVVFKLREFHSTFQRTLGKDNSPSSNNHDETSERRETQQEVFVPPLKSEEDVGLEQQETTRDDEKIEGEKDLLLNDDLGVEPNVANVDEEVDVRNADVTEPPSPSASPTSPPSTSSHPTSSPTTLPPTAKPTAEPHSPTTSPTTTAYHRRCVGDVLDDECEFGLTGFPTEALTIRSANLCDNNTNVQLLHNRETRCPEDPSCRKCREKGIKRFTKIYEKFNSPELIKNRIKFISENFPIKKKYNRTIPKLNNFNSKHHNLKYGEKETNLNKAIIVSAVNYGQIYLLLNFANSCFVNGVFDLREYLYVLPTDNKTYVTLTKLGFKAEPTYWLEGLDVHISENYRGLANIGGHTFINAITVFAANFLIQRDRYVLLMDVDFVFMRDIFPFLENAIFRRDVLGMYSPRHDAYGYMNTGFLYIKPTKKSKVVIQTLENLTFLKKGSDQILWNSVIRHYRFQQLGQRVLPRTLYFTMWGRATKREHFDRKKVLCLHAVSSGKLEKLVRLDYWWFNSTTPFYDAGVDKYIKEIKLATPEEFETARKRQQEMKDNGEWQED